jgi:Zn-dependent peptidase ImmA (M78 family)
MSDGVGASARYTEPRADELRARYLATFGGDEIPVPVESIAEDLLGLRIELADGLECSGVLHPAERRIVLRADEPPARRRFTIAHELGHWVCHALAAAEPEPTYCRATDLSADTIRAREREANIFAAELLLPRSAVPGAWADSTEIAACAQQFGVSDVAMHWRLHNLNLVETPPT